MKYIQAILFFICFFLLVQVEESQGISIPALHARLCMSGNINGLDFEQCLKLKANNRNSGSKSERNKSQKIPNPTNDTARCIDEGFVSEEDLKKCINVFADTSTETNKKQNILANITFPTYPLLPFDGGNDTIDYYGSGNYGY